MFNILIVLGALGISYLSATYGTIYGMSNQSSIILSAGSLIGAIMFGSSTLFRSKPNQNMRATANRNSHVGLPRQTQSKVKGPFIPPQPWRSAPVSTPIMSTNHKLIPPSVSAFTKVPAANNIKSLKEFVAAIEATYVNHCRCFTLGQTGVYSERFMRKLEEQVGIDEKLVSAVRNEVTKTGSFLSPKWKQMLNEQLVNRNEFSGIYGGQYVFIGKLVNGSDFSTVYQRQRQGLNGTNYLNTKGFLVRKFPKNYTPEKHVTVELTDVVKFADAVAFISKPQVANNVVKTA